MGRCCAKEIRMEYRYSALTIRTLLHTHPWWLCSTYRMTTDDGSISDTRSYSSQYSKWRTHSHTDESYDNCLSPLYYIYVVWVSRRILCRLLDICMARTKMMAQVIQKPKLYWWKVWNIRMILIFELFFSLKSINKFKDIFLRHWDSRKQYTSLIASMKIRSSCNEEFIILMKLFDDFSICILGHIRIESFNSM